MTARRTAALWLSLLLWTGGARGETFRSAPLVPGLGVNVLTRNVAETSLDRELFSRPYASVVLARVDVYDRFPYVESHDFQVVSDPGWNRLLVGEEAQGLAAYDGKDDPLGPLRQPHGMALGPGGTLYVADTGNERVLILESSSEWSDLTLHGVGEITGLHHPYDVAYADGGTPADLSDDRIYVADTGANRVVAFAPEGHGARELGSVGGLGSGAGRFAGPMALAVGKNDGLDTGDVYVADAHNRRIVHLQERDGALAWVGSTGDDFDLVTSVAVDAWGNLYLAGPRRGVVKLSPDLQPVAEVPGEPAGPRNVHVVFADVRDHRTGVESRSGRPDLTVVENWTATSGVRRLDLGVEVKDLAADTQGGVRSQFLLTDRAAVTAQIVDPVTGTVAAEKDLGTLAAGRYDLPVLDGAESAALPAGAILRVTARSAYPDGPVARAETLLAGDGFVGTQPLLLGNRPNPFRASTEIRFLVPGTSPQHVSVEVFDVVGRRIAGVLDRDLPAGVAGVEWNGRDDAGRAVGSGVYLYRVTVGERRLTAKMLRIL
jgi:DNA-binding beta-propeller fold protein YncE